MKKLGRQFNLQANSPHTVSESQARGRDEAEPGRRATWALGPLQFSLIGKEGRSATKDQTGNERWKVSHGCSRTIWQGWECWKGLYAGLTGNELQLSLQVSVVGLIRWKWLAVRVEHYWGRGKTGRMKLWHKLFLFCFFVFAFYLLI